MKTIVLVVTIDNGAQYDEYQEWIDRVYLVHTDDDLEQVELEWKADVVTEMTKNEITVNPHWLNIMEYSVVKNKKLYKKILDDNNFYTWLEKTYKVEVKKFNEVHL